MAAARKVSGSAKDDLFAAVFQLQGQFPDGGRLARPVDPDDQNDRRLGGQAKLFPALQHLGHFLIQHLAHLGGIGHPLPFDPFAQALAKPGGRRHAHVGHDQNFLQLLKQFLVNLGKGAQHAVNGARTAIRASF